MRSSHVTPLVVFALALVAAAIFVGYTGSGQTFYGDEWGYASRLAREPPLEALFDPPGSKYLIALPLVGYEALFEAFGMGGYLPFHIAGVGALLLCSVLLFVYVRRRLGAWPAFVPALLLMLLGAAGPEVVLGAVRLPMMIAIAAGLGALLALDRSDARGDVGASALLLAAGLSHPVSISFIAAAAVRVVLRTRRRWWRSAWIFLLPALPLAGLWLTSGGAADPRAPQLHHVLSFFAESLAGTAAALLGIVGPDWSYRISGLGWLVAPLGALLLLALALRLRARSTVSPELWAGLAMLFVLWGITAIAPGEPRAALSPRHLYPGALAMLLTITEGLRGVSMPRWTPAVALVVALAVVGLNLSHLSSHGAQLRSKSHVIRAEVAAMELARGSVAPSFRAPDDSQGRVPPEAFRLPAARYFEVASEFGTPALTVAELRRAPEPARRVADAVLAGALELKLQLIPTLATDPRASPELVTQAAGSAARAPGCLRLHPREGGLLAKLALPRGGATIAAGEGPAVELKVGRFSATHPVALGAIAGGDAARLAIPRDAERARSAKAPPWRVRVAAAQPVSVCGPGSSAL